MSDQPSVGTAPPVYYVSNTLSDTATPVTQLKEKDIQSEPIVNEMVTTLVGGIIVVLGFIFMRISFSEANVNGFVFYMMFLTTGVFLLARGYILQRQLIKSSERINKYSSTTYDEQFKANAIALKKNDIRGVNLLFYTAASLSVIQYIVAIYALSTWMIEVVTQWR